MQEKKQQDCRTFLSVKDVNIHHQLLKIHFLLFLLKNTFVRCDRSLHPFHMIRIKFSKNLNFAAGKEKKNGPITTDNRSQLLI